MLKRGFCARDASADVEEEAFSLIADAFFTDGSCARENRLDTARGMAKSRRVENRAAVRKSQGSMSDDISPLVQIATLTRCSRARHSTTSPSALQQAWQSHLWTLTHQYSRLSRPLSSRNRFALTIGFKQHLAYAVVSRLPLTLEQLGMSLTGNLQW